MIQFNLNEFGSFYQGYIDKAKHYISITDALEKQLLEVDLFYKSLPKEKQEFRYAEGKWTPKDILLHLIDAERIFTYRALCIARKDKTNFPGFEEDEYVDNANANQFSLNELLENYIATRNASINLFKMFSDEELKRVGVANDTSISVRAIGYIILGHEKHHIQIIKERYL